MTQVQDAAFWDGMYSRRTAPWDPEPNDTLAETAEALTPAAALDVGCGEGADALWLAQRGWQVTGVDLSNVALDRARAADPDHRVTWRQVDLLTWAPPADAYDLVTTHYLHLPPAGREAFFAGLSRAVKPGGLFLMAAHHPSDQQTGVGRPAIADNYFTAEEVSALLAHGRWEILEAGTRPHEVTKHGERMTIHDMVLKARRLD